MEKSFGYITYVKEWSGKQTLTKYSQYYTISRTTAEKRKRFLPIWGGGEIPNLLTKRRLWTKSENKQNNYHSSKPIPSCSQQENDNLWNICTPVNSQSWNLMDIVLCHGNDLWVHFSSGSFPDFCTGPVLGSWKMSATLIFVICKERQNINILINNNYGDFQVNSHDRHSWKYAQPWNIHTENFFSALYNFYNLGEPSEVDGQ